MTQILSKAKESNIKINICSHVIQSFCTKTAETPTPNATYIIIDIP